MFLLSFKVTVIAILQIFIIGLIGFILVKRKFLSSEGLENISRLVIFVTLPLLIICRFIEDFEFELYPDWWLYPILGIVLAVTGFLVAMPFTLSVNNLKEKRSPVEKY